MATAPVPNPAMLAISGIGNAINAYQDRRAAERMGQMQTEQLRQSIANAARNRTERIAWDSASLAEQIARDRQNLEIAKADQDANLARIMETLQANVAAKQAATDRTYAASSREVGRQQEFARGQGDAFASSLGQFANFNQDMAGKSDSLAAVFADALNSQGPSVAPEATGATADFEAAARAVASGQVGDQANKLAALQAFGGTMFDKGIATNRNQQLDSIIQNFARGSRAALEPEVGAESMFFQSDPILTKTPTARLAPRGNFVGEQFTERQLIKPPPSMLGDLFVGLGSLALQQANQPQQPPNPYALSIPTGTGVGLRADVGGLGLRTDRPSGLGIRTR